MSFLRNPIVVIVAFIATFTGVLTYVVRDMGAAGQPRAAQWKKVDEAVNKGLPQTAIKELEPIIESAIKDKAYPEAIKAIARKIGLEGNIQGNKPEERITRMKAEIAKAPKEMVPVMDAVLAHWYWHYFQQNKWRFMRRTQTAAAPGEDFTTWDMPRLFNEIDKQFTKALAAEKELKATQIGTYDALLAKGTLPDNYRPTLFDFVAHEAIHFYASPEQAGAKAEDSFEFEAGSAALSATEEFLKWNPETTDKDSRKLKAVRLFQNLLSFHQKDGDPTAYLDADLARLHFAYNQSIGEDRAARYKAAMLLFAETHAGHELSATARFRLAEVLNNEGEKVEAVAEARKAVAAYPNSVGGKMAHNLIQSIQAPALTVLAERVWAEDGQIVRVQYRNMTKVHFRAYKADWFARLGAPNRWRPEELTDAERRALLARDPDHQFAADLPATPDYHDRSQDIPVPKGMKPGFYFLFASPTNDFPAASAPLFGGDFWVSNLAIVMRVEHGTSSFEGFVLKAESGDPVVGAKVRTWVRAQNNVFREGATVETDKNGLFRVTGDNNSNWMVMATHEGHELASMNNFYLSRYDRTVRPFGQTVLFTDRSLYRPGQTVHFKGICLRTDPNADNYETIANKAITVTFNDVNGQKIADLATKTNDYGSFSGSFTAPRDRITGQMHLVVQGDAPGHSLVSVEEYKRPQFQVEVAAPKDGVKLGGDVKVIGKATAYTGAAIGGAKVKYRVTREVRYAPWFYDCFWWRIPPNIGSAQEIAHGNAMTEADGTFPITFVAKPDKTVPEKDEPIFRFTVHADVTDTNGETRSDSQTVQIGYHSMQANIVANSWLVSGKDLKLTVTTTTLDGEPLAAKGTVKIHKLKQPEKVIRPDLLGQRIPQRVPRVRGAAPLPQPKPEQKPDPADPRGWELGDVVATLPFTTDEKGKTELTAKLDDGIYRAVLDTKDKFDKAVTARQQLTVLNPDAKTFPVKIPNHLAAPKWSLEPGETFQAIWGTGYEKGRAFVEIEHRGQLKQAFWTAGDRTQAAVAEAITEAMRGGFTLRVTYVRENRAYLESRHVDVPWTNKQLTVKWERFVSKLEPGKKETWTAVITGPDAKKATAEMVAALYDQSLDAYKPHNWMQRFGVFRQDYSNKQAYFENTGKAFHHLLGQWPQNNKPIQALTYRAFPHDITQNLWGYEAYGMRGGFGGGGPGGPPGAPQMRATTGAMPKSAEPAAGAELAAADGLAKGDAGFDRNNALGDKKPGDGPTGPDLSKVTARSNLAETAFFFPHLVSGDDGTVRMEFTMPEALTKWKFQGFAHDAKLRSGFIGGETVTAKDLMVQPNAPRFLREGDLLEFTVKVSNQSDAKQIGKVRLTFADARTGKSIDADLGNAVGDQAFEIATKESRSFSWRIVVPDGLGPITYKAVGAAEKFSDGEEGMIPILSKRILVTESMPLPIRGMQSKTFDFAKLKDAGKSETLKHQSLTVQMASNPAWYAVQALPYLMEYPHECSEQTFNRLYANALARHIAQSDPKIRKIFDQWKGTPALDSPLEKNQDVKSAMLEETPWLRDAKKESEAKRNVGILFDDNRLNEETRRLMQKLAEQQQGDGAWPWFPGGPPNDYITLYITTGFGRMRHLGVKIDVAPAVRSVQRLDAWADRMYRDILKFAKNKDDNHLSTTIALYLYGRSFFLQDSPVAEPYKEAVNYWQGQAKKYWLQLANRQGQAHVALALKRFGDKETPMAILASIKERSVSNEELGMFWRDTEMSWWWYHAPIETQAMMIEAFSEVADDPKAVEDCKVWLLKQKQTQNWKTTKATADAVYALMLRGDNLLKSDALVEVSLGDMPIKPEKVEAGTGFYEEKFLRTEVKPEMGTVTVKKTDPGVAWGSVHWQYLEDISKVTPHDGTPLKLEKKLFKKTYTKKGPVLEEVKTPLQVGDEVVVRIVLRTDRDMEYVHLKDHRGSGTEPVNVLSRYKFQDGLAYYESTKDTASHFFIDYLPKGTYVFEYSVRAVHKGKYPTGLANIQCMYAPEFNSHSENINLEVK